MVNEEFDYTYIIFMILIIALGILQSMRDPIKYSLKNPRATLVGGFLALILITLLNSATENKWDLCYIISFLCFKKVSIYHGGYYVRLMLSVSYIAIILGGVQLIFTRKSNPQNVGMMIKEVDEQTRIDRGEKIEYVNARFESMILQFAWLIALFLIAPAGLLYAVVGLYIASDFEITWTVKTIFTINCIVWLGILRIFFLFKKYWVFKIIVSETGIDYNGFFRKKQINWQEITSAVSVKTGYLLGGKMVEVKTSNDKIYFPITMKEKGKEYPKLDFIDDAWIDSNNEKMSINPENCSLYQEIQKQLKA